MAGFVEFEFGDGVVALVELTAVGGGGDGGVGVGGGLGVDGAESTEFAEDESAVGPVGAGAQVVRRAGKVLHEALTPIGPILSGIHDHVRLLPDAPDELEIQFGIRLTSAFKMAIMTGGDVTFTVKAKWALGKPGDPGDPGNPGIPGIPGNPGDPGGAAAAPPPAGP